MEKPTPCKKKRPRPPVPRVTLTLDGASEASGLSPRTLRNLIGRGDLPSVTVGRRRLIPARALEEYLLGSG